MGWGAGPWSQKSLNFGTWQWPGEWCYSPYWFKLPSHGGRQTTNSQLHHNHIPHPSYIEVNTSHGQLFAMPMSFAKNISFTLRLHMLVNIIIHHKRYEAEGMLQLQNHYMLADWSNINYWRLKSTWGDSAMATACPGTTTHFSCCARFFPL